MARDKNISSPAAFFDDLDDDTFHAIARYIYDHARIQIGENKRELVRARLGKTIRSRGFSGYREYYQWMIQDKTGEAAREVMNAIATNLTSFFRENKHFEYMVDEFLPTLTSGRLRGWSAGCSTGQEVYTIAMILQENLPSITQWDIKLLATDIDTDVVAAGARGFYPEALAKEIPAHLAAKYFDKAMDEKGRRGIQAKSILRNMTTFRHLNLFSQWPFRNSFDFIYCRNVMIYFDRPTQEQLVGRYYEVLRKGGLLFIGHSESLNGINHKFDYVIPTVYRKN
jgi:chemotaxis protein methyltransferase CheR